MSERELIVNANIICMDAEDTRCSALAVENGRIVAVGMQATLSPYIDRGWPTLDLGGRTVLPGFIDTHEHLMLTGSQASAAPCGLAGEHS